MTGSATTAAPAARLCPWCGDPVAQPKRRRGSRRKFCTTDHKKAFWNAARRWITRAVELGLLTPDAIKRGGESVYASPRRQKIERLTGALRLTRQFIAGTDVEHAVVDLAEPDIGLAARPKVEDGVPREWVKSSDLDRLQAAKAKLAETEAELAKAGSVINAAVALRDDVRARYPGEQFKCPYMRALDAAIDGHAARQQQKGDGR